jgi:DNA-binding transcriptional ArsR family regulator
MNVPQTIRPDLPAAFEQKAEAAAVLMSALSHPKRLMLLCILGGGEMTVGDLAQRLGMGQSALSQHLAKLRLQGLVAARRDGQSVRYRVASDAARAVIEALYREFCAPEE